MTWDVLAHWCLCAIVVVGFCGNPVELSDYHTYRRGNRGRYLPRLLLPRDDRQGTPRRGTGEWSWQRHSRRRTTWLTTSRVDT